MPQKENDKTTLITESATEVIINHGAAEETIETTIGLSELNLVRMDMNVIEYPLFSKIKRRKVNQSDIN